jgi:rhomboid family GlyGly-CTERM serine protease
MSRFPRITLSLALAAAALSLPHAAPLAALLDYERLPLLGGRFYNLFTCHLTHWSLDHMLWDVAVFAVLGLICELRMRDRFLGCLLIAAVAIPLAIHVFQPDLQTYRGLSGIDSALFALLATSLLQDKIREHNWTAAASIATLCLAFIAKIIIEYATGATLFVNAPSSGFVPVPLAHLVGACAGVVASLYPGSFTAPLSRAPAGATSILGGVSPAGKMSITSST